MTDDEVEKYRIEESELEHKGWFFTLHFAIRSSDWIKVCIGMQNKANRWNDPGTKLIGLTDVLSVGQTRTSNRNHKVKKV